MLLLSALTFLTLGHSEPGADAGATRISATAAKTKASSADDTALLDSLATSAKKELLESVVYSLRENGANQDSTLLVRHNFKKMITVGGCPRDYSQPCPKGWEIADRDCAPPSGYSGPCGGFSSSLPDAEKEDSAFRCQAPWPCQGQCPKDFSKCPDGWAQKGDSCTAPNDYQGVCAEMDFAQVKQQARRARLAAFCGFSWPCAGGSGSGSATRLSGAPHSNAFDNQTANAVFDASGPIS